jgi:hypothetical protein
MQRPGQIRKPSYRASTSMSVPTQKKTKKRHPPQYKIFKKAKSNACGFSAGVQNTGSETKSFDEKKQYESDDGDDALDEALDDVDFLYDEDNDDDYEYDEEEEEDDEEGEEEDDDDEEDDDEEDDDEEDDDEEDDDEEDDEQMFH